MGLFITCITSEISRKNVLFWNPWSRKVPGKRKRKKEKKKQHRQRVALRVESDLNAMRTGVLRHTINFVCPYECVILGIGHRTFKLPLNDCNFDCRYRMILYELSKCA